jgi:hypothetical protein
LQWLFFMYSSWNTIIEKERRNERVYDPKFERTIEQGKIYLKKSWNDSHFIFWVIHLIKIAQQLSLLLKEIEWQSQSI